MHVTIILPQAHGDRDLEPSVFEFTQRLESYCGSIESCCVQIEDARAHERWLPAFAVRVSLKVFGETVMLFARASAAQRGEALAQALDDAFARASLRLRAISAAHSACDCGRHVDAVALDSRIA
jgi:hypothetical protein